MSQFLTDGDFTTAKVVSDIRYDTPIPGVATAYIAEQDFCQFGVNYTPLAIGTAHPTLANFYLQKETALQPTSVKSIFQWTRIYAAVPATHYLPTSLAYTFVGYYGFTSPATIGTGAPQIVGRNPRAIIVPGTIQFDYFRLDGVTYTTPFDVPVINVQKYYAAGGTADTVALNLTDVAIAYSQAAATPQYEYDLTHETAAAYPTREAYEIMIANKTPIAAVGSQAKLWLDYGNIVQRQTTFVLPQ